MIKTNLEQAEIEVQKLKERIYDLTPEESETVLIEIGLMLDQVIKERKDLQDLYTNLKILQNRIVFKSTTEAQAKQWRIQALGDVMETLEKLLGKPK